MKKQLTLLFCLALLGCQQQKKQRPADLIPESKMVRILADVHLAESQIESTVAYPDTALMIFNELHKGILKKHKVTDEAFRRTFNYYAINVPEMDKLYEIITDTLIAREAKYATKSSGEDEDSELAPDSTEAITDTARINRIKRRLARPDAIKPENETEL